MKTNTKFQMIAKTLFGLEEVLAEELQGIGAENIAILNRAVSFDGDTALMYRANIRLRTALNILKPIHTFIAYNEDTLYKEVRKIAWKDYLTLQTTFSIDSTVSSEIFRHSKYVALRSKDAIADYFRELTGERPSVDVENPDVKINIHVYKHSFTISIDSSGDSLYKRGYRVTSADAPINEILAAGMILLSGWDKKQNLIDPMCGSGTILIEAALIAADIAPGIYRKRFGFQFWNDYNQKLFDTEIAAAKSLIKEDVECRIYGSDVSRKPIEAALENITNAHVDDFITISQKPFEERNVPAGGGILISNPPYGERVGKRDINEFYKIIGNRLKQAYAGYSAWLISSNLEALKYVGLHPSRKIELYNGGLQCSFRKYVLYEGTKKKKNE
jgi:putative N6-adenine-specific DNA methylase